MKELIDRAKSYAESKGYHELADDFSQVAAMALYRGRKATLPQLFTDYLRQEKGDPRSVRYEMYRSEYAAWLDYTMHEQETHSPVMSTVAWEDSLSELEPVTRACLVLSYEWGLTLKEIANCFGLSEGRISQVMTKVKQELKCSGKVVRDC